MFSPRRILPRCFRFGLAAVQLQSGYVARALRSRTNFTSASGASIAKNNSNRRTTCDSGLAHPRRANQRLGAWVRRRSKTARGYRRRRGRPPQPANGRHISAVAAKISGSVVMRVLIAEDRSVAGQRIVSGPELLRAGAESAVSTAEYRPMVLDGKPVMMATTIRLVFKIETTTDPPTLKVREDITSHGQAAQATALESDGRVGRFWFGCFVECGCLPPPFATGRRPQNL